MFSKALAYLLFAACLAVPSRAAFPLEHFGADPNQVSVSGVSSGAYFAVQAHVIYSSMIMGVGMVAGGPYWCARANLMYALGDCMATGDIPVDYLVWGTDYALATRTIDDPINMANDKVYIYHSPADGVVVQQCGIKGEEYYLHYISDPANYKTEYFIPSAHAMVTDRYGASCSYSGSPYIVNCGYNAAFEMLDHIYGNLLVIAFDQNEFFPQNDAAKSSIDHTGYVYVPSGCMGTAAHCKVHIAFHGCLMQYEEISDQYITQSGYNEVGELNDIIILYPQTISKAMTNPNACWDWWGYDTISYASSLAPQSDFVKQMILRVTS